MDVSAVLSPSAFIWNFSPDLSRARTVCLLCESTQILAHGSVKRAFENLMHWKPLGMQLFKVME